jgi:plastocyanin
LLLATGCGDRAPEPAVLELGADTITLAPGVSIIEIGIGDAEGDFEPTTATAYVGDVLRFTARDMGSHAVVFMEQGLAPEARAFLESSGQLRGPPLLDAGTAWIVSLEGAPAGAYPFRCVTHSADGRLTVEPR